MVSDSKVTSEARVPQAETADDLVRDMLSLLMTDQLLKEPLLPSDIEWMKRASAYLQSREAL